MPEFKPVIRVLYASGENAVTEIEASGVLWFAKHAQEAVKVVCVEENGLHWFKAIYNVDPIAETSETVKTSFTSKQSVWEFMTSSCFSFVGIPVHWFGKEFVLTHDTEYPG